MQLGLIFLMENCDHVWIEINTTFLFVIMSECAILWSSRMNYDCLFVVVLLPENWRKNYLGEELISQKYVVCL